MTSKRHLFCSLQFAFPLSFSLSLLLCQKNVSKRFGSISLSPCHAMEILCFFLLWLVGFVGPTVFQLRGSGSIWSEIKISALPSTFPTFSKLLILNLFFFSSLYGDVLIFPTIIFIPILLINVFNLMNG